jgi:uncharacterized protein YkwD
MIRTRIFSHWVAVPALLILSPFVCAACQPFATGPVSSATVSTVTPLPTGAVTPATPEEVVPLVFAKVNAERAKAGLAPVVRDEFLEGLAVEHSERMARLNIFGHERYGWRELNFQQQAGTVREENLALTPVRHFTPGPLLDADEIASWTIEGWLASPSHRQAMLDGRLTRAGVAVVLTNDHFYITQDFEGPL